ncbi:unnamed protein product [Heligmosomoides polygyrus]|uniref:Uncharacterized protein n=1 Tax=Heligmosomoides polygyrus TaxID=6339 RepID=A0A3P7X245_HELPZ|nr:unnamed protein product [Heligmosomoides polygyrus]
MQLELRQLRQGGRDAPCDERQNREAMRCVAKLWHAIINMAAIRVLHKSPEWGSLYGCHLCRQHSERGPTKRMEMLTMERCWPDTLHLMDEGLTCDLFKVGKQGMNLLSVAMEEILNYSYSSAAYWT